MPSYEEALATIHERVKAIEEAMPPPAPELVVIDIPVEGHDWCWMFGFVTRAFLEHGRFEDQLAGNCPFAVDKETGEIHRLGTARSIEKSLTELDSTRRYDALRRADRFIEEVEQALTADGGRAKVRAVAKRWAGAGMTSEEMIERLEVMRYQVTDEQEDRILELMDAAVGWCSPHQRLYP